jgi:hypothetical protein
VSSVRPSPASPDPKKPFCNAVLAPTTLCVLPSLYSSVSMDLLRRT